jgi:hypothetical protein
MLSADAEQKPFPAKGEPTYSGPPEKFQAAKLPNVFIIRHFFRMCKGSPYRRGNLSSVTLFTKARRDIANRKKGAEMAEFLLLSQTISQLLAKFPQN